MTLDWTDYICMAFIAAIFIYGLYWDERMGNY